METLQRTANRGSVSTGYNIDNSVKMEADNTEYLNRVIASGGNRKTWTISAWVKRTEISDASHGGGHTIFAVNVSGNEGCLLRFNTGTTAATLDTLQIDIGAGSTLSRSHTSQVFRDTSAWYHIVLAVDTTQSTDTDRFKLYVNGELVTSYYSRNNPAQDFDTSNNQAANSCTQHIGAYTSGGTSYGKFCGYIAEVNHVDGTALAPTAFGEVDDDTGIWIPIKASPTYGTNGFFLDFEDGANMGDDESGNGLDFTEVNITAADQATDTPTNNFATGNPLGPFRVGAWNITEGATYAQYAGGNDWGSFTSTIAVGSGKWYVEIQAGGSDLFIGAGSEDYNFVGAGNGTGFPEIYYGYTSTNSVGYHANNGDVYNNGTQVVIGTTYTTNDIISVALDMDNGKIYFAKNGTYINSQNPATGANSIALPDTSARYFIGGSSYGTGKNHRCNYGGYTSFTISSGNADANGYGNFEYAVPSGFYSLNTKNLAEFG